MGKTAGHKYATVTERRSDASQSDVLFREELLGEAGRERSAHPARVSQPASQHAVAFLLYIGAVGWHACVPAYVGADPSYIDRSAWMPYS